MKSGGIGTSVRTLARGLKKLGHQVVIVGLYEKNSIESDDGVIVFRIGFPMENPIFNIILSRIFLHLHLIKIVKKYKIDIIEWPDFQGMMYYKIKNVKHVLKLHGTSLSHRVHGVIKVKFITQNIWEFFEKKTMISIDSWIGVSEWFLLEWKDYFKKKLEIEDFVYNPVDMDIFFRSNQDREEIVFFSGAFRKRKGIKSLVLAVKKCYDDGMNFRLVLMGYEDDVKKQDILDMIGLQYEHRVEFVDFSGQKIVADWMRKSKIFAMPSYYESCGNGWLESAACGTPVIGSILSCGPEVVRDGIDGILVDPDKIDDISDAIFELMTNKNLWIAMSDQAYERAKKEYCTEKIAKKSIDIYNKIIGK